MPECHRVCIFCLPRGSGDLLGLFAGFDLAPVMQWWNGATVPAMRKRQQEVIWLPVFGITASAALGYPDETQRLGLTGCRCDETAGDAIVDKILFGHWQPTIVIAAMISQLDLDPGYQPVRGKA